MATQITIDPVALANLLRSPGGQIQRRLGELAERVRQTARSNAPKRTGQTANRIVVRFDASRARWLVGVFDQPQASIALFQHEGTRPHRITGNPLLVFDWPVTGRRMFLRSVNHPGTAPNRFLTEALQHEMGRI